MTTRAEEIAAEGPYTYTWNEVVKRFIIDGPTHCKHLGWVDEPMTDIVCEDLNRAYKQGQQDRWIPVSDESKLPPIHEEPFTEDGFVLILLQCADWPSKYKTTKASRTIGDRDDDGVPLWFWTDEEGEIIDDGDNLITHWMPLPSTPNPEQP